MYPVLVCGSSWFENVSVSAAFRAKDAQEMPTEAVICEQHSAVLYRNDVAFYRIHSPETQSMNIDYILYRLRTAT
jgi:hypothetical protein